MTDKKKKRIPPPIDAWESEKWLRGEEHNPKKVAEQPYDVVTPLELKRERIGILTRYFNAMESVIDQVIIFTSAVVSGKVEAVYQVVKGWRSGKFTDKWKYAVWYNQVPSLLAYEQLHWLHDRGRWGEYQAQVLHQKSGGGDIPLWKEIDALKENYRIRRKTYPFTTEEEEMKSVEPAYPYGVDLSTMKQCYRCKKWFNARFPGVGFSLGRWLKKDWFCRSCERDRLDRYLAKKS